MKNEALFVNIYREFFFLCFFILFNFRLLTFWCTAYSATSFAFKLRMCVKCKCACIDALRESHGEKKNEEYTDEQTLHLMLRADKHGKR